MSTSMGVARYLLVVAGLASVAYLVATTGIDVLVASVRTLSWRLAVFPGTALLDTPGRRGPQPERRVRRR